MLLQLSARRLLQLSVRRLLQLSVLLLPSQFSVVLVPSQLAVLQLSVRRLLQLSVLLLQLSVRRRRCCFRFASTSRTTLQPVLHAWTWLEW